MGTELPAPAVARPIARWSMRGEEARDQSIDKSANVMLDELVRWATALKMLR